MLFTTERYFDEHDLFVEVLLSDDREFSFTVNESWSTSGRRGTGIGKWVTTVLKEIVFEYGDVWLRVFRDEDTELRVHLYEKAGFRFLVEGSDLMYAGRRPGCTESQALAWYKARGDKLRAIRQEAADRCQGKWRSEVEELTAALAANPLPQD